MNSEWLHQYLVESVGKNLCTRIFCTTCGAREFRRGLLAALAKENGRSLGPNWGGDNAVAMAHGLVKVRPFIHGNVGHMEEAVRLILFEIWKTVGTSRAECDLEPLLKETWAGDVLTRMMAHHERLQVARRARAEYESPQRVLERRAERRQKLQDAHARRLALKVQRDRLWREGQKKAGK